MEFLNRAAILTLRDESGRETHIVLQSLDGDVAQIKTDSGSVKVSFRDIEPYWFGDFRVLWRMPEYKTSDGFYSEESGEQLWISSKMMELANRFAENTADEARIKRLDMVEQVRWYQGLRGLTVDGIPGAMTVIQMNNDLGVHVPRLMPLSVPGSR